MGTEKEKLQQKLIELSESLGWSQRQLAKEIFYGLTDEDDPDELRRFYDRFKKGLQRSSIPANRLKVYIEAIYRHPLYLNEQRVVPVSVVGKYLSDSGMLKMKRVSQQITEEIVAQFYEEL